MKSLYIMRHGKSSWAHEEQSDHERPLMNKGVNRTETIAEYLKEKDIKPDIIISSSAVRAFETAKLIHKLIGTEKDIIIDTGIYHADVDYLMDVLYSQNNNIDSIMLFGHNPTFSMLSNQFLDKKIDWLPTSAVVGVNFDTDKWEDISLAKAIDSFYISPKMLK